MYNLKAAQMNMHYSLIQELISYKFEVGHNVVQATKNICDAEDEAAVDHIIIIR